MNEKYIHVYAKELIEYLKTVPLDWRILVSGDELPAFKEWQEKEKQKQK